MSRSGAHDSLAGDEVDVGEGNVDEMNRPAAKIDRVLWDGVDRLVVHPQSNWTSARFFCSVDAPQADHSTIPRAAVTPAKGIGAV
jgi:hypothetical protein